MPLVSVIVPVYKTEDYLDRCIQSIVEQTYSDLEIILIDDGSPDHSPEKCDAWAKRDARIRVIHKENSGVSSARNAGLKEAHGEWLAFVDSDDWLHPQFVELLLGLTRDASTQVLSANYVRTEEQKPFDRYNLEELSIRRIIPSVAVESWSNRFSVCGKLYSKEALEELYFDETVSYGEDALYNIDVFSGISSCVIHLEQVLYYYFIRDDSCVSTDRERKRVLLCQTYNAYAEKETDPNKKAVYYSAAIKRSLSTRFDVLVFGGSLTLVDDSNRCIKAALNGLKSIDQFSKKKYLVYLILYLFPSVYRLWRIKTDPTLLGGKK